MKKVIRRGVFETNSSSTHSLAIVKDGENKPEEISFEIRSDRAKMALLFGLIENSKHEDTTSFKKKWEKLLLRFKEQAILAFCEKLGLSREMALREIEYEAFADTELYKILGDEAALEKYLDKSMYFKAAYKESGEGDIVRFAEKYFIEDYKRARELIGRFRCDAHFMNGCLIECDCGFHSYIRIANNLGISLTDTDEELLAAAKRYLDDGTGVYATEWNAGIILEVTGEVY